MILVKKKKPPKATERDPGRIYSQGTDWKRVGWLSDHLRRREQVREEADQGSQLQLLRLRTTRAPVRAWT